MVENIRNGTVGDGRAIRMAFRNNFGNRPAVIEKTGEPIPKVYN